MQLPNKIKNIDKEFKTGFLFGELLQTSDSLKEKISQYNQNPKNKSEIKENFQKLKKDLTLLGIYLNDSTINKIMTGKEGAASKLIYKIKTEMDRIKINFNNIIGQINENSYREKYELGKNKNFNNFNKTGFLELTQSNKFTMSPTMTTRETLSTFTNFFFKPNDNKHTNILLSQENKIDLNNSKYMNLKNKVLLKPIKSTIKSHEKDKINRTNKIKISSFKNIKKPQNFYQEHNEHIIEKINDESEKKNNSKLDVNNPDTLNMNKQIRKNKSISIYKKNNNNIKLKINALKNRNDLFSYDKYIKYSILDKNTKKLGININEIAPKLKKNGINYNKDYYLLPNQVVNNFKSILSSRREENKSIVDQFNILTDKDKLLNTQETFLKNSIINQINSEDELFTIKFKKNTSQYKMREYSKIIDSKNEYNINLNKKIFIERSYNKYEDELRTNNFDVDEYISQINNENNFKNYNEKKMIIQNTLKNYNNMKGVTNLIIDFVEECFKSQKKLEEELVEIPEYREWNKYFIEGKSCLKIPIKIRKDKNDNSKKDKESINITNNSSILTKLTKKSENKNEKKNTSNNNNELILMEYNDYLFYRGNWDINNFINKNIYGKYLHIYNVLGEDIFTIIPNINNLYHGIKPSILLQKSNSDFELKEDELNNILIPKSNTRNSLYGEIILLNFDNISNEIINNNITINLNSFSKLLNTNNDNNIKKNKNIEEEENNINNKEEKLSNALTDIDFSYIPIKLCFIGHSFSGRKTQAKLLCEKYKNLKCYSINDISKFYFDEYRRVHTPIEKNPKFKSMKKNQINQMKEQMEEEIKKYKDIFTLMEEYTNIKQNIEEIINVEEVPDELKIKLLIYEIKKDFPEKNENEINEQIQTRNQKRQKLGEELNKLKEDMNPDLLNNINHKENKKPKNKSKKNNNANNIQTISDELEKIINESFEGFILYDYPNNYNQYLKLENITTGYTQEIEEEPDKRDIYMNILTQSIDKPYVNISHINNEASSNLNNNNNNNVNHKSFFNCYILLELSEEETLKRMNNRLKDPQTGIIYHKEYSPPNQADKKLNDRLVEVTEPSDEKIKELISQFYTEYPKILYFIHLFNNLHRIDVEDKTEIFRRIENIISGEIKKFEEQENKDIMGNLVNKNCEFNDENEAIKYFTRLNETKKVISKEISEEIIKKWSDEQDKYNRGVKNFIKNFIELKSNILEQMNNYQEEFIDFLNRASKKYKLVDIFYKKYNILLEKFPYLKNNHLAKEEFDKNISELIDHIWELIQMRKRDSITELNNIKNQNFIENQLEAFGDYIINLIILETNQYYNKLNIIKRFYFEFENPKITEKFPYQYIFNKDKILEHIKEYSVFVPNLNQEESKNVIISPKINKLYNNCYKLFFDYDYTMLSLYKKAKEESNLNSSEISTRSKRRLKSHNRKNTVKSDVSLFTDNKTSINYEEEMKTALNNEKIKYKLRILFIKNFAEKNLKEIYNIGQATFNNLDNHIIESVNKQNNAMNELILKIKKNIKEGFNKLNVKDVELDLFDVYERSNVNFTKFNLNYLYSLPEQDKKINYNDLYMIYLDVKTFEIQNNYASVNTIIDIVFKKHLFEYKSQGFMKYMQQIPFFYLNNYINKYIIKKDKGYSLIKINELFTSLALLNIVPPKNDQQIIIMKSINDKLKYKTYLSKNDFMNCKMWFDKNEENNNNNNNEQNNEHKNVQQNGHNNENNIENENNKENNYVQFMRNASVTLGKVQLISDFSLKEKKSKRGSRIFPHLNNRISANKEISEERKLKEFLFNVNKNNDDYIDFIDFMKRITIKKGHKRKKSTRFLGASDIKSNIDKADILSQNSFVESIDKTQISESTTNYFKASKNLISNNLNISYLKDENKLKSFKNQKLNDTFKDISDDKININNNEIINFLDYTYFDYLIKKG